MWKRLTCAALFVMYSYVKLKCWLSLLQAYKYLIYYCNERDENKLIPQRVGHWWPNDLCNM